MLKGSASNSGLRVNQNAVWLGIAYMIALLVIWGMHAVFSGVLSAPIVFLGRWRVHWQIWELLVFVIPFVVWCILMFSDLSTGRKSLSNLVEPFYFALAIPVVALVRVAIGTHLSEQACAAGLIALVCVISAATFFLVPVLPE
jgi:hypothetical protein